MPVLTRKDWTGYLVELVVVVVGILIAFQVDEWREHLQRERDLHAALVRLKEETQSNVSQCAVSVPLQSRLAASVQLVLESIQSGALPDTDIEQFNYGLTHIGFLPGSPYLFTVVEEMIATGLLKELDDPGIQTSITTAQVQMGIFRQTIATQSRFIQSIVSELARSVEFTYVGRSNLDELRQPGTLGVFEDSIDVTYDFGSLARNRYFRNLLIETADGYHDLNRMNYQICARIDEISEKLAELGIN